MQVVRLIGLKHHDWDKIRETIGVGNLVTLSHDSQWDKPEGKAYKAEYGGFQIGYIPLVPTLREYYKAAQCDAERDRLAQWGQAASKVREWLDSRVKYNHEESWMVPVHTILFRDQNGVYNSADIGEPTQISIAFEEVD